jgi:hypothetical protein
MDFSLLHKVQIGSETHSAGYPTDEGGFFLGDKAAGA